MQRISPVDVSKRVAAKGASGSPAGGTPLIWWPLGGPKGRAEKKPAPTQWPPEEWTHFPTSHDPL